MLYYENMGGIAEKAVNHLSADFRAGLDEKDSANLLDRGWRIPEVLAELTASLGLGRHETPEGALAVMPEPLPDTFCAPATWTGNGFASSATTLP